MSTRNWSKFKAIVQGFTPPILWKGLQKLKYRNSTIPQNHIEWQYVPEGWEKRDPKIKGWNVAAILETYQKNWSSFLRNLEGNEALAISPESNSEERTSLLFHNIMMSYGYALTLATRHKTHLSLLDWGGGMGHYYLISKTLIPDLEIDYHCKDVPVLVESGKQLFPKAHFYTDDCCLERQYDFILVSGSFQYAQDWQLLLKQLVQATGEYLFITRLPTVQQTDSFIVVQRPYQYGYDTEYLGWCLNRQVFLETAKKLGLQLIREFLTGEQPQIYEAPEQCMYRGFLFRLKK